MNFAKLLVSIVIGLIGFLASGCHRHYAKKQVTIVKTFDKNLSLTRDNKTKQLYLQSKNGEPQAKCGNYCYAHTAGFLVNDYQRNEVNLNQLIDINSIMLDEIVGSEYYLHDKNYRYTIVLTLCDNQVSYQKSR